MREFSNLRPFARFGKNVVRGQKTFPRERFSAGTLSEAEGFYAIIAPSVRTFLRKSSSSFAVSGPHLP